MSTMIPKWKTLLTNWINCYSSETHKREQNITPENLLNIFTHIHESFRLDDSKSSKFEASTIQDFIVEKYPGFKFENGTLEVSCEEEVYIVASLLLFFICVNSKNAEIKTAMCSKLSAGDQETIMKFSKCLMDCSPILYADVEAAIAEACGPEGSTKVSETPPALRSLHGEVRRLQAALDAERFDRNYLQDELARTNLKLEKLTKVKEQYKLDILSLKAKISLCCGEKRESHREARADEFIGRLQRQLQELEARLEDTLGQLEDVQQERDTYKEKVANLKQERDKWLTLSQQEADRACQLADQLDSERRTVATLRDLVSELRQHNRNNGLDSSMLECDDPDTSIQSLSNLSVCNEVCANVIEVQLMEERAKIEVLKQQIESLQEQLAKANQTFESEKLSLEAIITEKDSNILNLNQQLNEERQEKSELKSNYEEEINNFNKQVLELSKVVKSLEENSKHALEEKVQEMQLMQKQFIDETDKLNIVIKNLQEEVEKVINLKIHCDAEIVQLNNKIVEMSQSIKKVEERSKKALGEKEQEICLLHQKLTDETERTGNVITNLEMEMKDQINLKTQCDEEIYVLSSKIAEISQKLEDAKEKSIHLLDEKEILQQQLSVEAEKSGNIMKKLKEQINEQNNSKANYEQEIVKLNNTITEMTESIREKEQILLSLQRQLSEETEKSSDIIKQLEEELRENNNTKMHCEQEIAKLNNEIIQKIQAMKEIDERSKHALIQKEQEIMSLQKQFKDEKLKMDDVINSLKSEIKEHNDMKTCCEQEIMKLNNKVLEMSQATKNIEDNSKYLLEEKEHAIQSLHKQHLDEIEKACNEIADLKKEINEKNDLKLQHEEKITELNNKIIEMSQAMKKVEENTKVLLEEKEELIQNLQQQFAVETEDFNELITNLQKKINELNNTATQREQDIFELYNKIIETTQIVKDAREKSKRALEDKEQEIEAAQQKFTGDIKKIEIRNKVLEIEALDACELKKSCEQEIAKLNTQIVEMTQTLKEAGESLKLALEGKIQEKHSLQKQFTEETEKFDSIIQNLKQELETEKYIQINLKKEYQNILQEKDIFIEELKKEVEKLNIHVSSVERRCKNISDQNQKEVQSLNEEIAKLNNKIAEMTQTMNDLEDNSKIKLQEKARQLQLQHQQFTAEREKSENIIKNLKIELEAEKYAQLKLKDDFDNRIMKLNEKVLNRNNELVELQNNIIQKSEMIEVLQSDMRREKELREDLSNTCNHQLSALNEQKHTVETEVQQKLHEITGLQKELQEKQTFTDKLSKEIENLTASISNLEDKCKHRDSIIKEKQKEIEFLNEVFQKEQEKLNHKIDERSASVKSLQMQLHNEIEYKIQLQHVLSNLETSKQALTEELNAAKILMKDYEEKTLAWDKQRIELEEQIQADIHKINKLEEEKAALLNEIEVLKEIQNGETKDHEDKIIMLDKQKMETVKQIQAYALKIEKIEDDNKSLLKKVDALEDFLRKETHNYEENRIIWDKEKTELEGLIQDSVKNIEKLTNEKTVLLKEMDVLKAVQTEDKKNNEEKTILWEKQKAELEEQIKENVEKIEKLLNEKTVLLKEVNVLKAQQTKDKNNHEEKAQQFEKHINEMKEQIQDSNNKNEQLENEKVVLLNEISTLKTVQERELKTYEENKLTWEKQNIEINEQMRANVGRIKELENGIAISLTEMEAIKDAYRAETNNHKEDAIKWEKQTNDLKEQLQANIIIIKKLEDEKSDLLKELIFLKTAQSEKTSDYEKQALTWITQKRELDEQINTLVLKVENLKDEKAMLLKEMEALKMVQTEESKEYKENMNTLVKQSNDLKEEIQANVIKVEKLEFEKAELLKEIEERKTTQIEEIKSFREMALKWEKAVKEMEEQIQVNIMKVEKLEEEKATLLKELEALKTVKTVETKECQEKAQILEKEKNEMNQQLRAHALKAKELEEKKEKMLKTIEELMAAQTDTCFKKEHEEKIRMLENKEKELKDQMQADVLKVEMMEQEKLMLLKELEAIKAAQKEMLAAESQEKISSTTKHTSWEKEIRGIHHQVDTTTSDLAHSSMESLKTISDLEKIIQDKNRKITSMQIEISYIKSMMAESGIKLIDVTKELEVSKNTCQELSSQLKKLVQQKNEEISDLKRQVAKMSVTENRASQIIKVSAKYQAMILKRIAEIKSNAVLKELTNFGNQNSNGEELRRSIGSVTMEDLENFLETTDRHLKRCSEKQMALQKDRDRLTEVNRINESEIINMKKFLTEMSVSFRTFSTVKEVYAQKLSKIVSLQRTVRRDILSLDGRITEATMCKLERGYAAVMQDLSECAMNLERWVDRSVSRMLSPEKIKQAFTSDLEQATLSTSNYQNASVEVQLSELENSFQKLLVEIGRAQKGEGARTAQEVTIMEVRAEYEDKLSRMKSKMKELFHEEMARLKQKQADEIAVLERELLKCREKMAESSRAYEEHIRALTTELWSVGEKFLVKQEEADWLRKKQSGSLMSLQHIHSSGLHPPQEVFGRPSDTYSLRSLPVHNKKTEGRGLHMSDEEGEVFDNRFLKELSATPRASLAPGQRISELKRRNSLVPPHLKSSYPAEMQFAPTLDEEDIKCASTSFTLGRGQRKEVGITAYKKPGPPTPSKQAGRLSATDSELRESLRVERDPQGRKTSTPSRIRSLFRSNRNDTDVVTPRSRRFSSIFRKK